MANESKARDCVICLPISLLFIEFLIYTSTQIDNDFVVSLSLRLFYRTKVNFGASSSRYFTELQKAGFNMGLPWFNLKVWMFMRIKHFQHFR